jgi:hypothetical protein
MGSRCTLSGYCECTWSLGGIHEKKLRLLEKRVPLQHCRSSRRQAVFCALHGENSNASSSSVWVREGGKVVRRKQGSDTTPVKTLDTAPPKFMWKRKGYEPSLEAQRPAYEKPLSARNQQILMALINQEHNAESVGKLMDAWKEELGMGSLVSWDCVFTSLFERSCTDSLFGKSVHFLLSCHDVS